MERLFSSGSRRPTGRWNRSFPRFTQQANSLEDQLRSRYPAVKLELTGEIPLNFDIRKASADEVQHSESLAIPATLALLLLAFGSVVAALIPLAVGELAIAATMAITGLLAARFHLSILVQNLATMLGLGLGIDYALLMVSRFREALCAGCDGPAASVIAARQAGHTLLISASTVAIGFLALLTVPISEIRSIGVAGILVAGMCVLLATTVVPAVLALLGHRIDAGRLPFKPQVGCAMGRTHGDSMEAMGNGDCCPSLACPPSGWRTFAFACLAGHAARYQSSPRELASAGGGIGACAQRRLNKWAAMALLNRCASLSNCRRIRFRKPTRGGMPSIVSPSSSRATLVATA